MSQPDIPWNEDEYTSYLSTERQLFAWCLEKYGDYSSEKAKEEALSFYDYEPASKPFRGLVFHDLAWHWAMLEIFGESYWNMYPELESPPEEYKLESERLDKN